MGLTKMGQPDPSCKRQASSGKPQAHNLWLNCGEIVAQPEVVPIYPAPTPTTCQVYKILWEKSIDIPSILGDPFWAL
tara:strand:+ start:138 stop:368 length:231 start_codon:yes stop_codon:yes gene_type:complete